MEPKFHFILVSILTLFSASSADEAKVPKFAFSWLDDKDTFKAGETATIKIKVLGSFDSKGNASLEKSAFKPLITVNGKTGNSSYISGVFLDINDDPSTWQIVFIPILAGIFNLFINDDPFKVMDSSLHFTVEPGPMYPSASVASWLGSLNEFEAGSKAQVLILPKDAFGNKVISTDEMNFHNISVTVLYENGSIVSLLNTTSSAWTEFGYIIVEFIAVRAGNFLLNIQGGNQTLNGSPLPFKVNPGPLDVSTCVAKWKFEFTAWQIFSKMELLIYQQDQYWNPVPGLYEFDADVIEVDTNLSIPVIDLQFEEVEPGVQLFSFSMSKAGNFLLTISDMKHNKSISYMPYAYTVFVGYCDGLESIVNGTGLNTSVAGERAEFSVYLRDAFQYPSPVEVERLQVEIRNEIDCTSISPTIYPTQISNGEWPDIAISETETAPTPSMGLNNTSQPPGSKVWASAFNVTHTPTKSGIYQIYILCGNIILNNGTPFTKEVKPGEVNLSVSGVVKFAPKAPKLVRNEILVQLMDSFSNPVVSENSKLNLELTSVNKSGFSNWTFVDNNDGSYIGHYLAMEVGTYEMCVSFEGKEFPPCPFAINVYGSKYFPKAYDDIISLWEDESISFDVLENDYFSGSNASIVEFTNPVHGSLLQYGRLFRYTPYKDYFGNDFFVYTISDINGDLATATVNISVLTIPPQFVSFPSQLQAIEDLISPRFGGYNGFELKYSDPTENISVILSAKYGTIFLSPMPMQFWQPIWSEFCVNKGDDKGTNLTIQGRLEVINFALRSIQYLGNGNFSGNDTLRFSARNRNGVNELDVQVVVDPINDPPYVNVPEFIILKKTKDDSLLFNKEIDQFLFSVGDPDVLNFPGGESGFKLTFSVEVDDGFLLATLPAGLIDSTELKQKSSFQWQPIQTYVTISKHFMVKAIGIRFRASLNGCNTVMQQLSYHGGEHGDAVLTVKLNDLGHYGCYSDCVDRITKPLVAQANVNLVRRKPMSSLAVRSLESAIVIEFVLVVSLGLMIVFFTCKCAILLVNEKRRKNPRTSELSRKQSLQLTTNSSEDDGIQLSGFSNTLPCSI